MRARRIRFQCFLEFDLGFGVRMVVEVELAKSFVKFGLVRTQLQGRLIFLDGAVEILAKGEAFRTQLVRTPGIGKRFLQLRVRFGAQGLVGAREPVAGLGIFAVDALHLAESVRRGFVLLQRKLRFSQRQPLRRRQLLSYLL